MDLTSEIVDGIFDNWLMGKMRLYENFCPDNRFDEWLQVAVWR
jgi:hypothetical protein